MTDALKEIIERAKTAEARYGEFKSTHEALGVAFEEFNELVDAIRANALESVRDEAIDLAAVLYRLANEIRSSQNLRERSVK